MESVDVIVLPEAMLFLIAASGEEAVAALLEAAFGPGTQRSHRSDGSPYIAARPDVEISLSHCRTAAVLAVAPAENGRIGVDIEQPREQLRRVARRFLSVEEQERHTTIEALQRAWTIKEAVYKAAAIPGLALAADIHLPTSAEPRACCRGRSYALTTIPYADTLVTLATPSCL